MNMASSHDAQGGGITADLLFSGRSAEVANAGSCGDVRRIKELIGQGADPNEIGVGGANALLFAVIHDNVDGARALLECGADPYAEDDSGECAIHLAAGMNWGKEFLALFSMLGLDLDRLSSVSGRTPMFLAAIDDHSENLALLIAAGCDVNRRDTEGQTPLHQAALLNQYGAILQLLEAGANPLRTNNDGQTFQFWLGTGPGQSEMAQVDLVKQRRILVWLDQRDFVVADGAREYLRSAENFIRNDAIRNDRPFDPARTVNVAL